MPSSGTVDIDLSEETDPYLRFKPEHRQSASSYGSTLAVISSEEQDSLTYYAETIRAHMQEYNSLTEVINPKIDSLFTELLIRNTRALRNQDKLPSYLPLKKKWKRTTSRSRPRAMGRTHYILHPKKKQETIACSLRPA